MFSLNPCVPQDVRAEISDFLPQLSFEVTRKHFNSAALQCELLLRSQVENRTRVAKGGEDLSGVSVLSQPDLTDLLSLFSLLCMPRRRLSVGFGNSATSLLLFKRILLFFIQQHSSFFPHLYAVDVFGPVTTSLLWDNI